MAFYISAYKTASSPHWPARAAGLQPIALAQRQQAIPQLLDLIVVDEQLEAILARVAGASDQRGDIAEQHAGGHAVERYACYVHIGRLGQNRLGQRALQRQ